ncbi:MAG: hypothetical protein KGR22_01805 [Planctomycetes bacterium]|nr:hypothetical protein [Planctomycetota bacterium]
MMHRVLAVTLAIPIALAISAMPTSIALADDGDLAGPIWGEGDGDKAGASPATAMRTKTVAASDSSGGTVTSISGSTGTTSLVGTLPDSVDLYEIFVFSPTLFDVTTQGSSFNTRLFLFKKVVNADGSIDAIPLAANDNVSTLANWSRLHNTSSSAVLIPGLTAGAHYLAVTNNAVVSTTCPRALQPTPHFSFTSSTAILQPVNSGELCDWTGSSAAAGAYTINIVGGVRLTRPSTCDDAPVLGDGSYAYSTVDNQAEGSENNIGLNNICGVAAAIRSPTWFRLDACTGSTTVRVQPSISGTAAYGFVVYTGACGSLTPIACSDTFGTAGELTFASDSCQTYYVAYGPLKPTSSTQFPVVGPGTLIISCTPSAPDADINGDGVIDGNDLALLLSQWGS